jgi:Tol biopolymer transport system component
MKTTLVTSRLSLWLLLVMGGVATTSAQLSQLVSATDPAQVPPAGGSGDSWGPVVSPDGRYVLFASTANNLLLTTNNTVISARFPTPLNVYLRDREDDTTTLVSVNISGVAGGNGDSLPVAISTNGRYALLESSASDLVSGDTNAVTDVFVRDLVASNTVLVSVSTNSSVGNSPSRSATMTPDGRYVAFVSAANNLVAGDTNRIPDVFVRDLQAGVTVLASVGAQSTNRTYALGSSEAPELTPDGRYVAFFSTATNLVAGAPAGGDVYVRDLVAGTTTWASVGARSAVLSALKKTSATSYNHALSADGQFVAYEASSWAGPGQIPLGLILRYSRASGLTDLVYTNAAVSTASYEDIRSLDMTPDGRFIAFVANTNNTTTTCVQLWDATTATASLVSGGPNGQVTTNSTCDWPSIDSTGRFVAFVSSATNLTTNALTGTYHIYVRDMQAGTFLVDADTNGVGTSISPATVPAMTPDARFIGFDCLDSSLVANDRNHDFDLFVRDLVAGTTELISAHDPSLPSGTPNAHSSLGPASSSADGRFVAFSSEADNLASNDTNGCRDVFVRDLATGVTTLVSVDTNGFSGDGVSTDATMSPDGRYIAFTSSADNLVAGDNNNAPDVFIRDLQTGTTTLVSVNSAGSGPGNRASYAPIASLNGRFVLFRSLAYNLVTGSTTSENLFLRDVSVGTTTALTTSGVQSFPAPTMTPDGRFIAYFGGNITLALYVWDSLAGHRIYTNSQSSLYGTALSANGRRLAFSVRSSGLPYTYNLYVADLTLNTTRLLVSSSSMYYKAPRLNSDGGKMACVGVSAGKGTNQVYLFDVLSGDRTLVSHNFLSSDPGNGKSDSPDISADGRFIAYSSAATDIVPSDTNNTSDVFLFDTQSGANTLLSTTQSGGRWANNLSTCPSFSADGRTLLFQSWASDLIARDLNSTADVFSYTLLYAIVVPDSSPGQAPWLSWPWSLGVNYRVQYKDKLDDSAWQDLSGSVTNNGSQAWLQDSAPASGQRFYRVVAF